MIRHPIGWAMLEGVADLALMLLALVAGGVGLWWVVTVEPHWCSRDGLRFTARVHPVDLTRSTHGGRWREVRVRVAPDGIALRGRGIIGSRVAGEFSVIGCETPDRRDRVVYLVAARVDGLTPAESSRRLALRIPGSSRARTVLDALVATSS